MKYLFSSVAAVLACVSTASAWGPGHPVAAEIAEGYLTPRAREAVNDLLEGKKLSDIAGWADVIRKTPPYQWSDRMHGARLADDAASFDFDRDCAEGCVISAIERMTAILRDPGAPRAERVDALKFIVHFIPDMHQPLHVVSRKQSSTAPNVTWAGETMSLHKLWDRLPVLYTKQTWQECARDLRAAITPEQFARWARSTDPAEWANESQAAARRYAYTLKGDGQLSVDYLERAVPVCNERLSMSAVRLAVRLNQIFSPRAATAPAAVN